MEVATLLVVVTPLEVVMPLVAVTPLVVARVAEETETAAEGHGALGFVAAGWADTMALASGEMAEEAVTARVARALEGKASG